jgi:hypothetical protein
MEYPHASPFGPIETVSLAVSATTGSVALGAFSFAFPRTVRIVNPAGGADVYVKFGTSDVDAAATDMLIPVGATEKISVAPSVTHIAAITASGTATLNITSGHGV